MEHNGIPNSNSVTSGNSAAGEALPHGGGDAQDAQMSAQQTLFYPLLGRAEAFRKHPELFPDPWAADAEQIAKELNTPATSMGNFPAYVYGVRRRMSLVEIRGYLKDHPGAAVVNLGCGLDWLALDLHGADCTVYELDFPSVHQMRDRVIERAKQTGSKLFDAKDVPATVALRYSIEDHRWMEEVDASKGAVILAAGVMYYLEIDDVRALIQAMAERFPGGLFAYDAESPLVTAQSEKMVRRAGLPETRMPFRLKDPRTPARWSKKVASVDVVYNFLDYLPKSERATVPARVRFMFRSQEWGKGMYQVRVRFTGTPGQGEAEAS